MSRRHELVFALNAGGVDPEAISRADLEKSRLAGEHPVDNLLPRVLGPITLRPGSESLTALSAETLQLRFLRALGSSYILLLSPGEMRISLGGTIQQVPAVSTTINSNGWASVSSSPATATVPGLPVGLLLALTTPRVLLTAGTTTAAIIRQTVTVAPGETAVTHILRLIVETGPVFLRVGTTAGAEDVLAEIELETGTHKIAFVPGAETIYVELQSKATAVRAVSVIQFESNLIGGTGDLVIPTPWDTMAKIRAMRTWQSIDTMFVGDGTNQQRRIEHRGPLSWGLSLYKTDDGPFRSGSNLISMTPSALSGNATLTASQAYFQSGHVGSLVELTSTNITVSTLLSGLDQATDYITVVGVGSGRTFYKTNVPATFVGTIVLERSFDADDPTSWSTYNTLSDTGIGSSAVSRTADTDGQDNITVHYRYRVTAYTSGSTTPTLEYESGLKTGRARITAVQSSTLATIEILQAMGATHSTRTWRYGDWSDIRGWPRTPIIHDDRLHWFRQDNHFASKVSDYYDFDDSGEGDNITISRSVGSGGQSGVLWGLSLGKLIVGTEMFEATIAASELDEALTQTKHTVRKPSRQGCLDLEAVEHSDGGFFVQRSGRRLYEISMPEGSSKHRSQEVSRLNPAAYRPGIDRHDVQQQPDTRHWSVVDGQLVCLTYEKADKVVAVSTATIAGGAVEDVCCLPDTDQDDVYLIVNRSGTRYHERLAKEADQRSVSTCALLDAHKVLTGSISSITGATHLAGQTVAVWADGQRRADATLNGSGAASLGATYARVVYGLPYTAAFKSVALAYGGQLGTALGQDKIVHGVSVILSTSCLDGVTVGGTDETYTPQLYPLDEIVNGAARTANQLFERYAQAVSPVAGAWSADARVCFEIDSAEGPCTVQSLVLDVETRDGAAPGQG